MIDFGFYNMDCMDGMKEFPDKYFDLAIIDPPYGININNNIGRRKGDKKSTYKKIKWDDSPPNKEYFDELFRVSKNQIIWGANHFIEMINKNSPCWIVWDKIFSEDVSFASVELAWTSFDSVSKRLQLCSQQNERIHPTQKPIALYEWILKKYANKENKILDTHVGSASSLIACYNLDFEYVGFEKDVDYYNDATERLEKVKAQVKLSDLLQVNYGS